MHDVVKIFAPASVANVAVGYDVLGFALEKPGDEVILRQKGEKGLKITKIIGDKGKLPKDLEKNTAGFAAKMLLADLGYQDLPLEMEIIKKMRLGTGLGSSAASAVAGVMAVNELLKKPLDRRALLKYAVAGEQIADGAWHADNVAPSLLGGVVLIRDNESLDVKKISVPHGLFVAMIYPHIKILTSQSRAILSDQVSLQALVGQTGNMGGFVAGMFTSDFGLIKRSLKDMVIEPQRAHLIPHYYDIKTAALKAGAMGFNISGAGPSMFALCDNNQIAEEICEQASQILGDGKIESDTFVSKINLEGAIRC